MENKPVNIFWTGGWDSTFRVLQLLIEEKRKVQPYFIVRAQRSVGIEIQTMVDLRRQIFRAYPFTQDLLKPTQYTDIRAVGEYEPISNSYKDLKERYEIAHQYDFCSRFCRENHIHNMELSIEKESNPQVFLAPYFKSDKWIDTDKMDRDGRQMFEIFKYYRFPLFKITKKDMVQGCNELGWNDIMKMTWFCATPYNGKPCGFCGPCTYTIEEGLSWRIPLVRRFFSKIHMPFRRFYRKNIR